MFEYIPCTKRLLREPPQKLTEAVEKELVKERKALEKSKAISRELEKQVEIDKQRKQLKVRSNRFPQPFVLSIS